MTDDIRLANASCVPVLDFGPFRDGTKKQAVADDIFASLRDVGFVYLINHGLNQDKINDMFEWSKRFFDLPLQKKMLAPHPPSGSHHRGYSAPSREKVSKFYEDGTPKDKEVLVPDVKESFECGKEDSETMPNIWLPDGILPGFKEACLDFFWTCYELELAIFRALALGLQVSEDYFLSSHTVPDNQLRLLHYPPVLRKALESEQCTRISAHADFGSITLLFQDNVGGLEVEDPKTPGQFQAVPPVQGAVIVNAGDFLMRWSNDIIKSTIHRVRAPPGNAGEDGMTPARYSIPYFCAPDLNQVVDCIPSTWSAERPKKYQPTSAMDYIVTRLAANY